MKGFFSFMLGLLALNTSGLCTPVPPNANGPCQMVVEPPSNLDYQPQQDTVLSLAAQVQCDQRTQVRVTLTSLVVTSASGKVMQVRPPAQTMPIVLTLERGLPQRVNWNLSIPAQQWEIPAGPFMISAQLQLQSAP